VSVVWGTSWGVDGDGGAEPRLVLVAICSGSRNRLKED
jgi:hypothetical protein